MNVELRKAQGARRGEYWTCRTGTSFCFYWQEQGCVLSAASGGGFRIDAEVLPPSMDDFLCDHTRPSGESEWAKATLAPGEHHPRIHRETRVGRDRELNPRAAVRYPTELASTLRGADGVFMRLREVFRTVEPCENNGAVYGHELRHLLILACTEVESAWRAVLIANDTAGAAARLSTRDYVKLAEPMRLAEWRVRLASVPDYPELAPFARWPDRGEPTKALPWYNAYNETKHDREGKLGSATLAHVIEAAAALYVMIAAQFGVAPLDRRAEDDFVITAFPKWLLSEMYVPPGVAGGFDEWTGVALRDMLNA